MFSTIFNTLIYNPLYNGLVFLLNTFPFIDVGIAVVLMTIVVKLILFPLSRAAARTQIMLRALAPQLEELKKKYKDTPQEQAQATLQLYKKNNVKPFSSFFLILVQLPVIFALYFIFLRGGLPDIHMNILYPFITAPQTIDMHFLGILDVTSRSIVVALLTGISQYIQISLVTPKRNKAGKEKKDDSLSSSFAQSMQFQMRYFMPVVITIISYTLPSLIGLYWITSNVFTILQELFVRREMAKKTN